MLLMKFRYLYIMYINTYIYIYIQHIGAPKLHLQLNCLVAGTFLLWYVLFVGNERLCQTHIICLFILCIFGIKYQVLSTRYKVPSTTYSCAYSTYILYILYIQYMLYIMYIFYILNILYTLCSTIVHIVQTAHTIHTVHAHVHTHIP